MAVQSVCEDPREFGGINIIARILTNLKTQFGETTQTQPKDGWYSYGLGIQALCVSNQHVPISTTLRIINGQSSDGSYGTFHSVDETGQMLLAAICARKQVKNNFFLKRWLTLAINKASTFLLTDINLDNTGNIWIGNKYSTPAALLGLQKAGVTFGMCNVIAHNMANGLEATEPEGALSQRLPAMSGKSVLVLGSDDWTCLVPDPIPAGYVPSYTPDATSECYNVSASGHISVKLSVQDSIGANVSGPYDSTQQVNNVENGNTLLQVMTQAQCEGIFQFETTPSSFGEYVVTVNGVTANDTIHQYWALINANTLQYLSVGVSQYVPGDGENILFQLSVW
ncbi:unnamed protein product [Clavelina lepadiformis]|uniref:Uncharacterized protein n=1 Tax=Clavelina lepadiformis TaxID=159417 RepID=A0ABP0FKU0_CLALP